jgi:hypothetical protein
MHSIFSLDHQRSGKHVQSACSTLGTQKLAVRWQPVRKPESCGHHDGLLHTTRLNGLEPYGYLEDVLEDY